MIIAGAGIAGCIAGIINQNATIIEAGERKIKHKAVLRFRSNEISKITGIPFKKVKVYKSIVYNGRIVDPNIKYSMEYSKKVTGGYSDRSISNCGEKERWVAPDNFHDLLLDMCESRISYNTPLTQDLITGLPVISTAPISVLANILEEEVNIDGCFNEIFVTRTKIKDCDVYASVYFPGSDTSIYRASITGEDLIVESLCEINDDDLSMAIDALGLVSEDIEEVEWNYSQKFGKIAGIDESERKHFIWKATHEYNVYSLGRFATWRNILLDDVIKDVYKIREMINQDEYYNRKVR